MCAFKVLSCSLLKYLFGGFCEVWLNAVSLTLSHQGEQGKYSVSGVSALGVFGRVLKLAKRKIKTIVAELSNMFKEWSRILEFVLKVCARRLRGR